MFFIVFTLLIIPINVKAKSNVNERLQKITQSIYDSIPLLEELGYSRDVIFELSLGNEIMAYELVNKKVKVLHFSLFPLVLDEQTIGFVVYDNGNDKYQISTSLVYEYNKFMIIGQKCSLLYTDDSCLIVFDDEISLLAKSSAKNGERDSFDPKEANEIKNQLNKIKGSVSEGTSTIKLMNQNYLIPNLRPFQIVA